MSCIILYIYYIYIYIYIYIYVILCRAWYCTSKRDITNIFHAFLVRGINNNYNFSYSSHNKLYTVITTNDPVTTNTTKNKCTHSLEPSPQLWWGNRNNNCRDNTDLTIIIIMIIIYVHVYVCHIVYKIYTPYESYVISIISML